jgi:hypothetical protein
MKAITLWQPYASLIGRGKVHETRSWPTRHRGPILIHASRKWTADLAETSRREPFHSSLRGDQPFYLPLPLGAVVALADLVACNRTEHTRPASELDLAFGDWTPGRWAWRLAGVRMLDEPIPCSGKQGLWYVSELLERRVLAALTLLTPTETTR